LQTGLVQRVTALNMFVHDIYHDQNIIRAGIIPAEQMLATRSTGPEMQGINVPSDIYAHIAGVDIVRAGEGEFYVLEDNLRVPSGVSYMLEDRKMMMRLFPELFARNKMAPVDHYPDLLLDNLRSVAPMGVDDPTVVVMTPGMYNSAYFEHAFLAQQMGVALVEGKDLFVSDNTVYMRTTRGPKRVDVIYRRIDDDYLDPLAFRPTRRWACRACCRVRAGRVTLANAIGTGVADDKSIYPFVPDMIKFYLGEEPMLNNVPTYQCRKKDDLAYTLANLGELVVKEVHGAGGYGMLVGPASTRPRSRISASACWPSRKAISPSRRWRCRPAPPMSKRASRRAISTCAPSCLSGKTVSMVPGGLTRVALQEGSLVVNSSQGGGTKDTWILEASMLSRTADHLFWMARYTERAENTARMLDVACVTSLMPQSDEAEQQGWRAMLGMSELESPSMPSTPRRTKSEVHRLHGARPGQSVLDRGLPDRAARENARAVRGTLTTEVWETQNTTWLVHAEAPQNRMFEHDPSEFLEWVKYRSHLSRGVTLGTMFQDEAFNFIRLGTFLERADNTARILDVKFRFLASDTIQAGAQANSITWRPVAFGVRVRDLPQGLPRRHHPDAGGRAVDPAGEHAAFAGRLHVRRRRQPARSAQRALARDRAPGRRAAYRLQSMQIDDILEEGLHEFLTRFLASIGELGNGIGRDFLLPVAA
jgi:uncharacterized circularly permuted ATP-grasp superfamily protein/uncharacterized alpha-E superfamily protein